MPDTPPILSKPLDVVLRAIREERAFRQDFSAQATAINDKIYSFYTNPNCSCKATIIEWINNNVDTTNTIIAKNEAALSAMTQEVQKAAGLAATIPKVPGPNNPQNPNPNPWANPNTPNAKFGKILNIERTDAAYAALITRAMSEKWLYRGLTVVPTTVAGVEVWSVFFF